MDVKITNGDIEMVASGDYRYITGIEEAVQRVRISALTVKGGITLHIRMLSSGEVHHVFEAIFKGFARALSAAVSVDPRVEGVPSTKGVLRPAIPVTAILQDVKGPYVWVVGKGGAAERRYIARGNITDEWQFVEKGLSVGELLVAEGGHKVRKGMIVEPAPEKK